MQECILILTFGLVTLIVISPFFDSDIKATKWYNQQLTELRQNGTTDIRREMACGESTKASQEKSQEAVDGTR
jgi:hypothetical protein